jgi:hypothetical protein
MFNVDESFFVIPDIFTYSKPQHLLTKLGEHRFDDGRDLVQPTLFAAEFCLLNVARLPHIYFPYGPDLSQSLFSKSFLILTAPADTYCWRRITTHTSGGPYIADFISSDPNWTNRIEGLVNLHAQKVLTQSDFLVDANNTLAPYCSYNVMVPIVHLLQSLRNLQLFDNFGFYQKEHISEGRQFRVQRVKEGWPTKS